MENNLIYSDKLVDVDDKGIRLKKYYFPLGQAKFVKFQDIFKMEKRQATLTTGKWRIWGSGNLMTWFPLDWLRPKRDIIFFIQMATQSTRIGFTVENTKAFIEAVESKDIRIENS
ncbi:hypothetical protein SAMN04488589_2494 [Methanolobus vulcani]|jgi:hypothetical protein|uniref:PH domain-containing protein n=1 Tax=Methanolobus vulcani TaxID=38026 RepID=A0A7Z7FDI2_9EURY|nr:hypothetical protein [Methanolobus vulcani]MDK2826065.1 hypothetical protein [Methanolobus sp.]MDK2948000.1 hypothetical protein [Methanolobus sp.]SDG24732.1 hypothetical protein SAMN04488589_2494 [Methanolobus vulcani]